MPVLVVAAVVLGTWYLSRTWQASRGPALLQRLAGLLQWVWKGVLALLVVAALAAMAQGCEGGDGAGDGDDPAPGGEPRYVPCPAFHEEDCPPAPAARP